jgi:hypothetical protein
VTATGACERPTTEFVDGDSGLHAVEIDTADGRVRLP